MNTNIQGDFQIYISVPLKLLLQKKLRVRVWAYSIGKYLYMLYKNGLTLRHRTYGIKQDEKDLLEWEEGQEEDHNLKKRET